MLTPQQQQEAFALWLQQNPQAAQQLQQPTKVAPNPIQGVAANTVNWNNSPSYAGGTQQVSSAPQPTPEPIPQQVENSGFIPVDMAEAVNEQRAESNDWQQTQVNQPQGINQATSGVSIDMALVNMPSDLANLLSRCINQDGLILITPETIMLQQVLRENRELRSSIASLHNSVAALITSLSSFLQRGSLNSESSSDTVTGQGDANEAESFQQLTFLNDDDDEDSDGTTEEASQPAKGNTTKRKSVKPVRKGSSRTTRSRSNAKKR